MLGYEALRLRRELGDKAGIASVLNSLGEYAQSEGDNNAARELLEECLSLSREIGDKIGIARALYVLGEVSAGQGDYNTARELQSESLRLRHELGSKRGIIQCLEGLAAVATAQVEPRRLVVLLAAADELRSSIGASITAQDHTRNEQSLEFARTKLGPDAVAAAWEKGKRLTVEEAIALALEAPAAPTPSEVAVTSITPSATRKDVPSPEHDLTAREVEVLRLVSVGLTNPEIAEHLSLSIYTVQTHLRSIFSKINVSTRSAAVRYAFEHSLG
jgi:DNA-binding NarL/FixJ family response regulator